MKLTDEELMDIARPFSADGGRWPSDWIDALRLVERDAIKRERVACGEIVNKKAAEVLAKNTYRGRASSAASFAAGMLEDVGCEIRARP